MSEVSDIEWASCRLADSPHADVVNIATWCGSLGQGSANASAIDVATEHARRHGTLSFRKRAVDARCRVKSGSSATALRRSEWVPPSSRQALPGTFKPAV